MEALCDLTPCGVCSQEVPVAETSEYDILAIPNISLLLVDGPCTPSAPRSAKTTYTLPDGSSKYCMQPAACRGGKVDVCQTCFKALKSNCLPEHSLVCYDAGPLPPGKSIEYLKKMKSIFFTIPFMRGQLIVHAIVLSS